MGNHMPSKKHGKTWKAEPHTIAKIEMLKAYLHAYFPILAQSKRGKPFLYVDGFAGPGELHELADRFPLSPRSPQLRLRWRSWGGGGKPEMSHAFLSSQIVCGVNICGVASNPSTGMLGSQ
jgi:hypothetical protein